MVNNYDSVDADMDDVMYSLRREVNVADRYDSYNPPLNITTYTKIELDLLMTYRQFYPDNDDYIDEYFYRRPRQVSIQEVELGYGDIDCYEPTSDDSSDFDDTGVATNLFQF